MIKFKPNLVKFVFLIFLSNLVFCNPFENITKEQIYDDCKQFDNYELCLKQANDFLEKFWIYKTCKNGEKSACDKLFELENACLAHLHTINTDCDFFIAVYSQYEDFVRLNELYKRSCLKGLAKSCLYASFDYFLYNRKDYESAKIWLKKGCELDDE
nr:hypothetical protein [Campylobacter sp.]